MRIASSSSSRPPGRPAGPRRAPGRRPPGSRTPCCTSGADTPGAPSCGRISLRCDTTSSRPDRGDARTSSSSVPKVPLPAAHQTLMPWVSSTRIQASRPGELRAQRVEGELVVGRHQHGGLRRRGAHRVKPRLHPVAAPPDVQADLPAADPVAAGEAGRHHRDRPAADPRLPVEVILAPLRPFNHPGFPPSPGRQAAPGFLRCCCIARPSRATASTTARRFPAGIRSSSRE